MVYLFYSNIYNLLLNEKSNNDKFHKVEKITEKLLSKELFNSALKTLEIPSNVTIYKNEFGKPFLKNSILCFSNSHSNGYISCCFSNENIGIDIQKYRKIEFSCLKYFWNEFDYLYYNSYICSDIINVWAQKEAVSKLLGCGMNLSFKNIYINKITENYSIAKINDLKIYLNKISLFEKCCCWIATNVEIKKIIKEEISFSL